MDGSELTIIASDCTVLGISSTPECTWSENVADGIVEPCSIQEEHVSDPIN